MIRDRLHIPRGAATAPSLAVTAPALAQDEVDRAPAARAVTDFNAAITSGGVDDVFAAMPPRRPDRPGDRGRYRPGSTTLTPEDGRTRYLPRDACPDLTFPDGTLEKLE